jgi:hypothetical protein
MANKPEFVDIISEQTQQKRRRVMPRVIEPAARENLTPWKLSLKSWKFKDWV